jgi:hypothetical protein
MKEIQDRLLELGLAEGGLLTAHSPEVPVRAADSRLTPDQATNLAPPLASLVPRCSIHPLRRAGVRAYVTEPGSWPAKQDQGEHDE